MQVYTENEKNKKLQITNFIINFWR